MPDPTEASEAYRAWAANQPDLEVFARPAWLDIVAPSAWLGEVLGGRSGRPQRAWAYVPKSRFGLRWAALPMATPYLGPYFDGSVYDSVVTPPGDLGYATFTVRDPASAWRFGSACRAMATQVIKLSERAAYSTSVKRKLRRGRTDLTVRPAADAADFDALRELLAERPRSGDYRAAPLYHRAQAAALAKGWVAEDGRGVVQGMAIVPEDRCRAYLAVQVRAVGAHDSTMAVLVDAVLDDLAARGVAQLDLESGYLPGVREFHRRLGARPEWYGLVRLSRGLRWRALEGLRSLTNPNRL